MQIIVQLGPEQAWQFQLLADFYGVGEDFEDQAG